MGNIFPNLPQFPIKISFTCACFQSTVRDQVDGTESSGDNSYGEGLLQSEESGKLFNCEKVEDSFGREEKERKESNKW